MKRLTAGLIVALTGLNALGAPYTPAQVVDSLSKRLDRVVTYRADAAVYEYSG